MRGSKRMGIETVAKNNGERMIKKLCIGAGYRRLAHRIEQAYESSSSEPFYMPRYLFWGRMPTSICQVDSLAPS